MNHATNLYLIKCSYLYLWPIFPFFFLSSSFRNPEVTWPSFTLLSCKRVQLLLHYGSDSSFLFFAVTSSLSLPSLHLLNWEREEREDHLFNHTSFLIHEIWVRKEEYYEEGTLEVWDSNYYQESPSLPLSLWFLSIHFDIHSHVFHHHHVTNCILFQSLLHLFRERERERESHWSKERMQKKIRVTEMLTKEEEMIFWYFFDTNFGFIHSWIWIYLFFSYTKWERLKTRRICLHYMFIYTPWKGEEASVTFLPLSLPLFSYIFRPRLQILLIYDLSHTDYDFLSFHLADNSSPSLSIQNVPFFGGTELTESDRNHVSSGCMMMMEKYLSSQVVIIFGKVCNSLLVSLSPLKFSPFPRSWYLSLISLSGHEIEVHIPCCVLCFEPALYQPFGTNTQPTSSLSLSSPLPWNSSRASLVEYYEMIPLLLILILSFIFFLWREWHGSEWEGDEGEGERWVRIRYLKM